MEMDSALEEEMNFLTQDDDDIVNNYYYSSSEELTHFSPPGMVIKREKSLDITEDHNQAREKEECEKFIDVVEKQTFDDLVEKHIEEIFPLEVNDEFMKEMTPPLVESTEVSIQKEKSPSPEKSPLAVKIEEEEERSRHKEPTPPPSPPPTKEKTPLPSPIPTKENTPVKEEHNTPVNEELNTPVKEEPSESEELNLTDKSSSRVQPIDEEEELDGFSDVIFNGSYVEIQLCDDDREEDDEVTILDPEEHDIDINDRTVINSDHDYVTKSEVRSSPSSSSVSSGSVEMTIRSSLIDYLEKKGSKDEADEKMKSFVEDILGRLKKYQVKEGEKVVSEEEKADESEVITIQESQMDDSVKVIEIQETQVDDSLKDIEMQESRTDDSSKAIEVDESLNDIEMDSSVQGDVPETSLEGSSENVNVTEKQIEDSMKDVESKLVVPESQKEDSLAEHEVQDSQKDNSSSVIEIPESQPVAASDAIEVPESEIVEFPETQNIESENAIAIPESEVIAIPETEVINIPGTEVINIPDTQVIDVPESESLESPKDQPQDTGESEKEKAIEEVLNKSIETVINDQKEELSIHEELKKTTNIDISIDDLLNPPSEEEKKSEDTSEETTETTDGSDDTTEDTTTSEDLPDDGPEQARQLPRSLSMDLFEAMDELPEDFTPNHIEIDSEKLKGNSSVESIDTQLLEVTQTQHKVTEESPENMDVSTETALPPEVPSVVKSFESIETQTEASFTPKDESINKLYEFASKLMEECRIVSEENYSSFHEEKLEEITKFVQLYKPLPEKVEISIQTEKFISEKRLKKQNEKERKKLLASSESSESESEDSSSSDSESKKSFGNSDMDLSQFLQSDLLVNDEGNVDLGESEEVFNQLGDEVSKKEKPAKDKDKMTEEELERLREEEEDREIERLVNFKGLKKRRIHIQYYSKKIEKPKDSPRSDKKSDEDTLHEMCSEAQKLSDDSHSEAEEEVITEQQFLEKINEKTKADLLNTTSEEDEEEEDDNQFNEILNSEEEDENKSTPLVDTFLKSYDPFEDDAASGDEQEKAIDADEIQAMLPAKEPSTPNETKDEEEKKTDDSIENPQNEDECEILDEGLKRKQIRPKSLDKLLADADKRKKIAKIDEDLISLSSSSSNSEDSDVEEVASEDNAKKRMIKPMLRADQLAGETKHAQRQENDRIKRLDKKETLLHKAIKDAKEKGIITGEKELILDYNSEKKEFIKVHPDLVKLLKDHQFEGIKFMYDCCYGSVDSIRKNPGSGCILAHCMGLGKTLQLIALLHTVISYKELKTSKVLVLCPKSTVMNWADEILRWLEPLNCRNLKVFTFPDTSDIYEKLRILEEWSNSATNPLQKKVGCLLIGYEAFRTLVFYASYKKRGNINQSAIEAINTKVQKLLINPGADLVVCDEGHIIKNRRSATSLAVAEIKTAKRIILTGTPIQNNLKEYYAMVNFIKPLFLGTEREFANLYANPIKAGQHKDSSKREIKIMKQRSYVLHKKLSKFVQRKEAALLKTFLPEKYEYVLFVPMTETQNRLYEFILEVLRNQGGSKGKTLIIDYTCLRKIWTHPKVLETAYLNAIVNKNKKERKNIQAALNPDNVDDEQPDDVFDSHDGVMSVTNDWWKNHLNNDDLESLLPSNKLLTMLEILRMCEEMGEKCLIFSAFVAVLNVVEHFLKKINEQDPKVIQHLPNRDRIRNTWVNGKDFYRLDGKTPKSIRHELIKNFNNADNDRARVFLISAKAGGQGINLIGANRVIILDTSWNPSNDQQNIFRIFRLGQKKNCYIYRLLAMGTMEEKVYSRSVTKQAMSFRVVDEQQIERHYSMAELAELYTLSRPNYSERPVPKVPQDAILAYMIRNKSNLVYKYHEHDSLLQNKVEQELSEQDKEDAWAAYEHDMRSTNENTLNPGVQALYQNFMGQQSLATNYLQSLAGFNARGFNPSLPGFGLDSMAAGFNFANSPYTDMLNMYPNYLSSGPPPNPFMFGNPPTSVAAALSAGSNPNYNPPNFMSSPPPSVSPIPSLLNNPLSALSNLSFGHNQQRIGPSTSPFANPRNTPPNGPPPTSMPGSTHEFDLLRRKFENYMQSPSLNPIPSNLNRYNSPQPMSLPSILNRASNPPPPPKIVPADVPQPQQRNNQQGPLRVASSINSPLHINPNLTRSLSLMSTSPKSFSPKSNSPSIPTSVIMKKKQNSPMDPAAQPPNKRGRSNSPQVNVMKTVPQAPHPQPSKHPSPTVPKPPEVPTKESVNKNNVAETSRPINIGIHYPEKTNVDSQKPGTLNMGIVYPSAVSTVPKPTPKPNPPAPAQRLIPISRQSPILIQNQAPKMSPLQKTGLSTQIQKNVQSKTTSIQKNLGNTPTQKTFPTTMPKNSNVMPKLQPTSNKAVLPTPKAKAGSGMQIIPTTGAVVNSSPKSFDNISPSISLTALNPKPSLTSQRNKSPSTVPIRSGLQIKHVKGADGRTQIVATSSANSSSVQKTYPVTLVRTPGQNTAQVVGSLAKGGVPPLAKVSNVSTLAKPDPSKPSMVSVNLNKLNESATKNQSPSSSVTAAAKAMISLSNSKQVVMKQGKQIVVKKVNGNGSTAVQIPQSQMQIIKKATLPIGISKPTPTVPPLTISKTATGATIKKITIPDPNKAKVVLTGNAPGTKVVTTNPPNQTVKVISPPTTKRIELNSKTLAAVRNSINANNSQSKSGIIIVDGNPNKKFNITKSGISNQIGNTVQNLPSGATITRVIQRKRPAVPVAKILPGQPTAVTKLVQPQVPLKRRKIEVNMNAGAGTSGGQFRIANKNPPIVEID